MCVCMLVSLLYCIRGLTCIYVIVKVVREKVKTFAQASVGTATTPGYPCPQFKVKDQYIRLTFLSFSPLLLASV